MRAGKTRPGKPLSGGADGVPKLLAATSEVGVRSGRQVVEGCQHPPAVEPEPVGRRPRQRGQTVGQVLLAEAPELQEEEQRDSGRWIRPRPPLRKGSSSSRQPSIRRTKKSAAEFTIGDVVAAWKVLVEAGMPDGAVRLAPARLERQDISRAIRDFAAAPEAIEPR